MPRPAPALDWASVQDEAVDLLRALVRFESYRSNEIEAARFVAARLIDAGVEPAVLEPFPGRGSVVGRLRGDGSAGHALLLFGHLDVVPPGDASRWTHPPFAADVADGCVWGRGTLDMKYMVASQLAIVLALARAGLRPRRDLVFAATADEETGGARGVGWILENRPELIDCGWALTEFGGFSLDVAGRRFYMVQTGEKGFAWFKLEARGAGGHGSMPLPGSAVVALCEAAAAAGRHRTPIEPSRTSQAFVETIAAAHPWIRGLLSIDTIDEVLARLPLDQALLFAAVVRNTISVNVIRAGDRPNVIPPVAEAEIDCRLVPGQTIEAFRDLVQEIVGPAIDVTLVAGSGATEQPLDTPLWEAVVRALKRYDAGAEAVPFLMPGGTDGRFLARKGIVCYGFSPIRLPGDLHFLRLIHSDDERIPVDAFREGVRVLGETVLDFCW